MHSRVSVVGYPIHPMLISFPIAFAVGSLFADIIALSTISAAWAFTGYVLTIGVFVTGLIAFIPGLIDAIYTVPSGTGAKRSAFTHMVFNLIIVGLFICSWFIKNSNDEMLSGINLVLESFAVFLLVPSGWLGWMMVYKYGIGVGEAARPVAAQVGPFSRQSSQKRALY